MNLVLGICAAVAALVGAGLLWWRRRVGKEIALMASLETSGAGSVAAMAPGAAVEVKGTLRVRIPLIAEFSQQPAAYHKSEIEREETYYERDSDGRDQRKTRTTHRLFEHEIRPVPGRGPDRAGRHRLRRRRGGGGPGRQRADRAADGGRRRGDRRHIVRARAGTQRQVTRKESILAPDIPIYVLGEVREGGLIGKPAGGSSNKTFVISHKSEEERTKSLTSTTRWLLMIALILFVAAVGLAVMGVAELDRSAEPHPEGLSSPSRQSRSLERSAKPGRPHALSRVCAALRPTPPASAPRPTARARATRRWPAACPRGTATDFRFRGPCGGVTKHSGERASRYG